MSGRRIKEIKEFTFFFFILAFSSSSSSEIRHFFHSGGGEVGGRCPVSLDCCEMST